MADDTLPLSPDDAPSTSSPANQPLLATKLFVPRVRANAAPRPRLLKRLNGATERTLALVSAPAGFGKTTLLAAWARGLALPAAWLTLDSADNDPLLFFGYLAAALQQVAPQASRDLAAAVAAARPPPLPVLVAALINDLSSVRQDFVLVLDDFHSIEAPPVLDAVRELVTQSPPALHLVIATREDPPLPLARLRGQGQLVELRAHDLRFTVDETAALLRDSLGLALTQDEIAQLDARIEGWVAGLQLAGLSLQNRSDRGVAIAAITSSHHYILSYLTEEVLSRLAPNVERFLLETSILNQLTGPLCDAVTGRQYSAGMLDELYASNVFVLPLDDEHRWYRYHPLFAELLRNRLERTTPGRAAALHAAASAWYEQAGMIEDAVDHAFAAGDAELVVRLLEAHARPTVLRGYPQTVEGWLRRLAAKGWAAGPRANLAFGWSLLLRGRLDVLEPYSAAAEAAAGGEGISEHDAQAIRAESDALRAGLVSVRGNPQLGCELAERAVAECPPDDMYLQGMTRFCLATAYNYAGRTVAAIAAYRAALPLCQASGNTLAVMLIGANLALQYLAQGQLHAAADLCQQMVDEADRTPGTRSPSLAAIYGNLASVLYEWNEVEAAHRLVQKWLDLSRRGGHVAAVTYGLVVLSRCEQAQGNLEAAQAALNEAGPGLKLGLPAWVTVEAAAQQAAVALVRGDEQAALGALEQAGLQADSPFNHTTEVLHVARLAVLVWRGALAEAEELAGRLLASAEPAGRMACVLQVLVLRAQVRAQRGDVAGALGDMQRALAIGEPQGYVRVFVNQGAAIAPLLAAAEGHNAYREKILAALPLEAGATGKLAVQAELRQAAAAVEPLVEPLSERELEVLHLIADGLTYQEIADRLIVSLNTVRFHVKSIYGKLGVDKRFAAITRATALGLL